MPTVAIGCDHAGYAYKDALKSRLSELGYQVFDLGTNSPDSVDYPDFAHAVAQAVTTGQAAWGVVMCGSGNGVAIAANKHANIRAALCWTPELAKLARNHNDANILAVPVRFISQDTALQMLETFASETFEGGRHTGRVAKIPC